MTLPPKVMCAQLSIFYTWKEYQATIFIFSCVMCSVKRISMSKGECVKASVVTVFTKHTRFRQCRNYVFGFIPLCCAAVWSISFHVSPSQFTCFNFPQRLVLKQSSLHFNIHTECPNFVLSCLQSDYKK